MLRKAKTLATAAIFITLCGPQLVRAGDWPLWRYDAQRSAASPESLPAQLHLQWVRKLPPLKVAWPDQAKMQFDAAYQPVVMGRRLFVGSSHDNSLTAYDTRTGDEVWRFWCDGPVRFAPLAWQDRIYFVADDGYLYCLRAEDGSLVWRFHGGPADSKILGNQRLISTWPARGTPVLMDGKIYFAAGIWPFMGIFLHALDANSGKVLWTNDGDGSIYIKQPHNSDSFAGVAPQGPLVAIGSKLLIPGGRSVPACYDRDSGRMVYYQLAENGKRGGGSAVAASDKLLFNGGAVFDLENEKYLEAVGEHFALADGRLFDYHNGALRVADLQSSHDQQEEKVDRKGEKITVPKSALNVLSRRKAPAPTSLIKAGPKIYVGSAGHLSAFGLPQAEPVGADNAALETAVADWQIEIDGTPATLLAADQRLFAVTLEGSIYCFGADAPASGSPTVHTFPSRQLAATQDWQAKIRSLLDITGARDGYGVVWGVGTGGPIMELVRQSQLRLVVIEAEQQRADALRRRLHEFGVGAERVSVLVSNPDEISLPPYLARLMFTEPSPVASRFGSAFVKKAFASLRPFGGVACLPISAAEKEELVPSLQGSDFAGATWRASGDWALLSREGPLPGSADWTHEHADASNTRVSKDQRVKAPLGLLWFGGPTNDAILPRHGHGPQPQVVDGRLFIEGVDLLRAMDIYTGEVLWESKLPGLGTLYDNTAHQPGANATSTNYIATPQGIYVAYQQKCLRLDPATGSIAAEYKLPALSDATEPPLWGYLNVFEDYLIGGADPLFDPSLSKTKTENDNYSASKRLIVMERSTGKLLWSANAVHGFRHNAICIGGGRIYCIDRMSGAEVSRLKRRGVEPTGTTRLSAFDLATGKEIWNTENDVFGTWLSYSIERDVLVEAGRVARDTLGDEPKGMRAYHAADGSVLWENKSYSGPAMIHHDTILMASNACELTTGKPRLRTHPLSGEMVEWTWSRNYGCNTPMASEHLLTFRSGAAGYLDFCNDGGTGNFGGFRSSCTNNLIVAGGLLNAPEYTRTCTCSYQNQTSLALIPMAGVETWTSFGSQAPKQAVRSVGINLGAPGDRKADDGTLWLEYPSIGGASPPLKVQIEPEQPQWFRRHSSQISGPGLNWVSASGAKGLKSLRVQLSSQDGPARMYTVRVHLLEPDDLRPGDRRFAIKLQGQVVAPAVDVIQEAGGRNRSLVKEFTSVSLTQDLVIELVPDPSAIVPEPILSGVEIQAQGW